MENQINIGDQNAQQIRQNPVNQAVEISEKPKINYWMISTIILIFVLLVSFGFYIVNSKKLDKNSASSVITDKLNYLQPTEEAAVSPTPRPTAVTSDLTVSWKTYTNEKYRFFIKFPIEWREKGPVADYDNALVYLHSNESFGEGPEPIQYYVWIYPDNKLPNARLTKESIGLYTVYKTDELPSRSGALTAFITKDERTYIAISITPYDVKQPYPSQNKYIDIFNQMLSTFKFTN